MGEVKKINDEYYIEFFARGLKYQQKAGTDRMKAEELLRTIEGKIAGGEAALIVRDVDVDIFFHDFREFAAKTYSAKTLQRYRSAVDHFFSFLQSQIPSVAKLSHLTPRVVEQYKSYMQKNGNAAGEKLKPRVVNLTLILLKDIFEYARKLGYLNDNPAIHTPLIKVNRSGKKSLNESEIHKILPNIAVEIAAAIEMILHSGLSLQEAVNLQWTDVDWERRILHIKKSNTSGYVRLPRGIPIHPKLFETLTTLNQKKGDRDLHVLLDRSGHPFSPDKLIDGLTQAAQDTHLEETLHFAALVELFVQSLINRGVPIVTMQKILGHDDILNTLLCSRLLLGQSSSPS